MWWQNLGSDYYEVELQMNGLYKITLNRVSLELWITWWFITQPHISSQQNMDISQQKAALYIDGRLIVAKQYFAPDIYCVCLVFSQPL